MHHRHPWPSCCPVQLTAQPFKFELSWGFEDNPRKILPAQLFFPKYRVRSIFEWFVYMGPFLAKKRPGAPVFGHCPEYNPRNKIRQL